MENKNIILCGVGGQGTVLASSILSQGLIATDYDVKMTEIHGMAQRGGSVTTQVRYGEKVYAPMIGMGSADLIVAFEKMEAYRQLPLLKPGGKVVVNDYKIPSSTVLAGDEVYPEQILDELKKLADVDILHADAMAQQLGNPKVMNVILLGALIRKMGLDKEADWDAIIKDNVKPRFAELNVKAFQLGMEAV
ncbi:MAG: indolepyruvate oxidoreductase subunit beta [Clostridiales bacterium]|nr:indolepyruvate oxidoreductase subunit beta [Clostridiales bacterium]